MIRPVTLVTFVSFLASGLYLYQVKHQAQLVDQQIRRVDTATEAARTRAGVLRAEYALLNDPDRLAQLAAEYLPTLKPTQPAQWSSMADIDRRLPPVGGPTTEPGPLEPAHPDTPPAAHPDTPLVAHPDTTPTATPMARTEPRRPDASPEAVAAARPERPRAAEPVVAMREAPPRIVAARPAPRPTVLAARAPALPRFSPAHRAPSLLGEAPTMPLAAAPLRAPSLLPRVSPPADATLLAVAGRPVARDVSYTAPAAEAAARAAQGAPLDASAPMVASALGMARTMIAVTPVSVAHAGTLYPPAATR